MENEDWDLKIYVYCTTGQDFYKVIRPTPLEAIDGIIFISDSQEVAYERNITSLNKLKSYFKDSFETLPMVICFNKQDLPNKFQSSRFLEDINYTASKNIDVTYTIALNGEGILSSFDSLLKLIIKDLSKTDFG